ncbi:MAG: hypothetical protein ACJASX_003969 [Limisphaerales bacterium]|jgi:hypothetical protein
MSFMAEPSGNPTIGRVLLDGSVIAVPPEHRESFATLLAHLELLALRSRRVLTSLNVDGVAVRLDCPPDWQSRWDEVEGHSISFAELSSRLISSAAANLTQLRKGVEKTVLLVMINDPRCLERTWSSWNPDVGNTLAVFSLLRQLWHAQRFDNWLAPSLIDEHSEDIELLAGELRVALVSESPSDLDASLVVSELLEQRMLPWLDRTGELLEHLHTKISND